MASVVFLSVLTLERLRNKRKVKNCLPEFIFSTTQFFKDRPLRFVVVRANYIYHMQTIKVGLRFGEWSVIEKLRKNFVLNFFIGWYCMLKKSDIFSALTLMKGK